MKARYESKGVRLDVYVEDDQNTVYDIEMQVRKKNEVDRYKIDWSICQLLFVG